MAQTGKNRIAYLNWVRTEFPNLYQNVVSRHPQISRNMQGLGLLMQPVITVSPHALEGVAGLWDTVMNSINEAIPSIVGNEADRILVRRQTERADQGAAPVPVSSGASMTTAQMIPIPKGFNLQKMLLPIGLGVGVLALMMMMRR